MYKNYKYVLEKYSGSKSRFNCPNCKRKEFTRYKNIETNEYLPYEYGICNRMIKCGYKKYPSQKINSNLEEVNHNHLEIIEYLDKKILYKFENSNLKNPLFIFLKLYFDEIKVQQIFELYQVKTEKYYENYLTVFPQLDQDFNLRALKKMRYNSQTGKRNKSFFQWYNPNKNNLKQCLFGLHILNEPIFLESKIVIVESEKTAILGMLYFENYLFLATGGMMNLTLERLEPLQGKEIILMPDLSPINAKKSAFDYWKNKAVRIAKEISCSISISTLLEEYSSDFQKENQYDLGDFIIENLINSKT
ncbi:DUF6371 domain-containing protein [Faecalibacter rhinopitheci]|uniref:Toprim domain-containing protein n=1 Tax=Faecalibacter rhinopitheci TaxID=2779678 RepID=A0A8J7FYH9_9FLAO|nr:DUF6371 domain-containing protein [Faecalibacter rhinopitheci]MBF0598008.1 hypothetical protein [Faecalibacter rhinopitheci]